MNNDHERGPFGHYQKNTYGHVLNALCAVGIPVSRVQFVEFAKSHPGVKGQGGLKIGNEFFAAYQYFDWHDYPLFRFADPIVSSEIVTGMEDKPQVEYRFLLSSTGYPVIKIVNPQVKEPLLLALSKIFGNMDQKSESFRLRMEANAIWSRKLVLGGPVEVYIEFWKPEGAPAFIKYLTEQVNAQ